MAMQLGVYIKAVLINRFFLLKQMLYTICLLCCSFLAWNYFGVLFFVNFMFFFYSINKINHLTFWRYYINIIGLLSLWHFGALFWMFKIEDGVYGFFINIITYTIPFVVFYIIKKHFKITTLFFIPLWLLFELILSNINFSFPWLLLGNVFSNQVYLIQWYEYCGVLGGSFWFLSLSYMFYQHFILKQRHLLLLMSILLFPIFFSLFLNFNKVENSNKTYEVVTYNSEKNKNLQTKEKLAFHILNLVDTTKNYTSLIIPEQTFRGFDNKNLKTKVTYHYFKESIKKGFFKTIIIGATGYRKKNTLVNSAIIITNDKLYKKIKQKLIPFTEYIPPMFYSFFTKNFYRFDVIDDLVNIKQDLNILPLICYEAFFSNYVAQKIGIANSIYLISSEKFMNNNSFALNQYDNIIRLRAIENRVVLLKASNYGWSFIIDPYGKVSDKKNDEINYFSIPQNNLLKTTYSKWGNKAT